MKAKWMVWVMVAALVSVAAAVHAQERPGAPPAGIEPDRPLPQMDAGDAGDAGDADGLGGPEAFDGLGLLLMPAAAPDGPGKHGGPRGRRAELHKLLNLTDEQKTKIADVHDKTRRAVIPIQGNLEVAHLDLRKLMRAEKPDARAIDAQIDKIAGLRGSMQKTHVAGMLEVRGLLTPEQQKTLRESGVGLMMGHRMRGGPRMRGGRGMRI